MRILRDNEELKDGERVAYKFKNGTSLVGDISLAVRTYCQDRGLNNLEQGDTLDLRVSNTILAEAGLDDNASTEEIVNLLSEKLGSKLEDTTISSDDIFDEDIVEEIDSYDNNNNEEFVESSREVLSTLDTDSNEVGFNNSSNIDRDELKGIVSEIVGETRKKIEAEIHEVKAEISGGFVDLINSDKTAEESLKIIRNIDSIKDSIVELSKQSNTLIENIKEINEKKSKEEGNEISSEENLLEGEIELKIKMLSKLQYELVAKAFIKGLVYSLKQGYDLNKFIDYTFGLI